MIPGSTTKPAELEIISHLPVPISVTSLEYPTIQVTQLIIYNVANKSFV